MEIQPFFEKIEDIIIEDIKASREQLLIAVAWFTNHKIFDALIERLSSGDGFTAKLIVINDNIVRTWQELNGEDCVPNEELAKKKSICTSRSFNGMISDKDTLRTHISNYASRCAEKLRKQDTVASIVGVFVSTNPFREDLL